MWGGQRNMITIFATINIRVPCSQGQAITKQTLNAIVRKIRVRLA